MEAVPPPHSGRKLVWVLLIALALASVAFIVFVVFQSVRPTPTSMQTVPVTSNETPSFSVETVASGLDHPWDVAFLPGGQTLFTERSGEVSILANGEAKRIAKIPDVKAAGEGGLMGLAVDPQFSENRAVYTCYTSSSNIQVVRWVLPADNSNLANKQVIIGDIPSGFGNRHQGCRIEFGPDGYLWIGTGDVAKSGLNPQTPQDPKSLAGKILRVDREGRAAPSNLTPPFDGRIFSYGHRNVQGIAFLAKPLGDIIGFSAEHGSTVDDEVNVLLKGNFGWDPDVAYAETGVPMTDKQKFPDSIDATWSSGSPAQAPSGMAVLKGTTWKAWEGALAIGMLKAQHLKILLLDENGRVVKEEKVLIDKGRLRDVEQAPDGSLYVTTDNGGNKDEILRLAPN